MQFYRYRKHLPLVFLCLFSLFTPALLGQAANDDDYRTFTDAEGRTIEARVIAYDGTRVTIERKDGQRFTVTSAIFDEKDQAYLEFWLELEQLRRPTAFNANFSTKFTNEHSPERTGLIVRERDGGYAIAIENRSRMELEDLKIHYWVFSRDTAPGVAASDRRGDRFVQGSVIDLKMKVNETLSFETKTLKLTETRLQPGYVWRSGAPGISRDTLRGLVFRMYYKDQLIQEWARPEILSREVDELLLRDPFRR
jgi:hypothetical protein